MTAAEVLVICGERGIALAADSGTLRFRAPKGALTQELRADLLRCKAELLQMLPVELAVIWDQVEVHATRQSPPTAVNSAPDYIADECSWIRQCLAQEWGVSPEAVWLWSPGTETAPAGGKPERATAPRS